MSDDEKLRDYLKRVTAGLHQARRQLREIEERDQEPIAVVAMGCRFPGGVAGPEDLWELVRSGTDAISGFPVNRGWEPWEGTFTRLGGFVYDVAEFDAGFFGISPREALAMDPQQRLLLEVCWEAVERAGIDPRSLRGSRTGVFAGTSSMEYLTLLNGAAESIEGYVLTGNAPSVVSGRVSYALGLEGPAVSVDTACSSSLVALHLARQALRSGECELALAGGVAVISTPGIFSEFAAQGGLAPDGRCKAFGADADGAGWAEGAGVLLVERLSDARRNGHPVLALITGSAVNQDGASNGLAAPNGPSQQRVIWQALADARVGHDEVDLVEAHGTGTVLGDPIEAQALIATYGQDRPADRPLWLGSVKSNIGHTQAAAGAAGLIKTVLAVQAGIMPRTLHADEPSPHVDWSAGSVRLLTQERDWPDAGDRPRRAGVSSFGISGTNAHVILEAPPQPPQAPQPPQPPQAPQGPQGGYGGTGSPPVSRGGLGGIAPPEAKGLGGIAPPQARTETLPWVVSGRGEVALRAQAARLAGFARAGCGGGDIVDAGWSLAAGRAEFEDRAVVLAADVAGFAAGLDAVAGGHPAAGVIRGRVPDGGPGQVVFVFPGQGSQWAGMTQGLAESYPAFAECLAECGAALQPYVDWPVAQLLREAGERELASADVVQPLLWAVMVALAAVWESLGVVPDAVAGHSQGEIAAATVAGILTVEQAARVVAVRSRVLTTLPAGGAMAAVEWPQAAAEQAIAGSAGAVWVAAVNSPGSVVLAGDRSALAGVLALAEAAGTRTRWLPVDYASHGPAVDAVAGELERELAGITPQAGRVPFCSAVTGEVMDGTGLDGRYWVANLRQQVRFEQVVRGLSGTGHGVFIEVSPHPVLVAAIEQTLEAAGQDTAVAAGTLRRGDGGQDRLLASAAAVFVGGVPVDWAGVLAGGGARRVDLPTYAFQKRRFWPSPRPVAARSPATGTDGWRYEVAWQPVAGLGGDDVLAGQWLLVVPAALAGVALTAACAQALAGGGAEVLTVEVAPAGLDRQALARQLSCSGGLAGVVSLLALDEAVHPGSAGFTAAVAGTLLLVQALGDAEVAAPLWVLTCGAAPADGEPASAVQAMVWGLGRVAALEHPRRWGGLVDLPPGGRGDGSLRSEALLTDGAAGWLRAVLSGRTGEDQVAIRPAGVLARRLVRAPAAAAGARPWRPAGPVLVTGGTGALGPLIARWLAGRGAPRVVLVSRRGVGAPGMGTLAARLCGAGSAVTVATCDVADRADLAALLDRLAAAGAAVRGVIHAAMGCTLAPLEHLGLAQLAQECAAKVTGAANLDELLAGTVDRFVLFSSIAAVWGSGDHGAYAIANAYLDTLAADRRARGLAGTSVPFGVWRAVRAGLDGRAVTGFDPGQLLRQGLPLMAPRRALTGLAQVLDADDVCTAVAEVDWARFAPVFTSGRPSPLLTGVPEARAAMDADADLAGRPAGRGRLAGQLAGLGAGEQAAVVLGVVCEQAAAVLGHDSQEAVRPGAVFRDLGFDSITAVELRDKLAVVTGLRLPATMVFDYPTPKALAGWLRGQIAGGPAAVPLPPAVAVAGGAVAVVAMGCRYPGGVASPEDLWELVRSGTDAVSAFPADRGWDEIRAGFEPAGGFVRGAAEFDAGFFGISPREALAMDPQQRLLLEVCWETVERAGIDPSTLRGSRTGVFTGTNGQSYSDLLKLDSGGVEGYVVTGTAASVVSGRVSYVLGLEGPAVSIDSACSSSLVALHLAGQALRSGECDLALAGGVMVMATPGVFGEFAAQGGLAADGRCKAFGSGADGMGLAEGVGMVLVERLRDARRNGHPVLAVIAGSAVNQDGASNGLTAPNGPSQQRVIRAALANAGLSADQVDVVEAHGTGTVLGDPIEAQALLATYGQERDQQRPLWLGSVKSNIGHAQAAAGAAGVIKMVMALRHQVLPRTLHAAEPSPHVDWSAGTVRLLTEQRDWPENGHPRRAAVSAFGISGTNAHLILEAAPPPPARRRGALGQRLPSSPKTGSSVQTPAHPFGSRGLIPWVVSGRGEAGLRGQAARLAGFARAGCGGGGVADVGWSLAAGRAVFAERAVVLASDAAGFAAGLDAVAAGEPADGVVTGRAADGGTGKVVFVFPGQGGQWAGMAASLARSCPPFAERLAECVAALQPHVGWPVARTLAEADEGGAEIIQPLLWAVMVALAAAWESVGVVPDAVAGHSQGEIAAATVAGILPLTEAARVVAVRSRAVARLGGEGAMASVAWSAAAAEQAIAGYGGRVWVAAVNSPSSVVLAGDRDMMAQVAGQAAAAGVRTRWVPVDYASHGPAVDAVAGELERELAGIVPGAGRVPLWSAVTGAVVDGARLDGGYWVANLREQVRFEQVIRGLAGAGYGVFIETSPHPVLVTAIEQTLEDAGQDDAVTAGTLRRGDGGLDRLLTSAAEVFVRGVPVDWAGMFTGSGSGACRVELPSYAFQRQRYWPGSSLQEPPDVRAAGLGLASHPLLAAAVDLAGEDGMLFTGRLSLSRFPWLADHAVFGTVLVPGAGLAEMAAWAGTTAGCPRVQELVLAAPLVLPPDAGAQLQVRLGGPGQDGARVVSVYSRIEAGDGQDSEGGWTLHASGTLGPREPGAAGLAQEAPLAQTWPPADAVPVPLDGFYSQMAERGYGYGPAFRGLTAAWLRGDEVFAEVCLPPEQDTDGFGVHPALLDAVLHPVGFIATASWYGEASEEARGLVPFSWSGVQLAGRGARTLRVRLRPAGPGAAFSVLAADADGQLMVSVDKLVLRPLTAEQLHAVQAGNRDSLFATEWVPVPGSGPAADRWAVLGGERAATAGLAAAGLDVAAYPDLAALAREADGGQPVPPVVVAWLPGLTGEPAAGADPAAVVRQVAGTALGLVQEWLTGAGFATSVLIVTTRNAVAAAGGEPAADLAGAAAWGLVRSAQTENPGRIVLADVDGLPGSWQALVATAGTGEPELAVRRGQVLGRRLVRAAGPSWVPDPGSEPGGPWRLDAAGDGTLGGVRRVTVPEVAAPLAPGLVRIAVRAAGLNFRDALITLGVYPDPAALIGSEGAGVVTGVGPGVTSVQAGDRVLGIWAGGLGPAVIADEQMIAKIPAGWSFSQAASVPVVFATAYYALVDLAGLRAGESVLVHAAASGVGMAAVQLARHLGAEVFATASEAKQPLVRELGVAPGRIASSRTTEFGDRFRAVTGGGGVDVVLDALAGEFVDASLGLVAPGGRFIEMGKADVRDQAGVAARWPGVSYQAFDLGEAGPERTGEILAEVLGLFARGMLTHLPVRSWDLGQTGEALRYLGQGRHTGKNVVRMPAPLDPAGTVLITGAPGVLGGLTAQRLVTGHGARRLLLTSRRGPAAPGAARLGADLAALGADVRIAACDAADRDSLASLLDSVQAAHPLTAVVHAAGLLDDGVIGALTPERIDYVMAPKVPAVIALDELTAGLDLSAFVLFSSASATFGTPGQGNYAAANAVLDALAQQRRSRGLPAVSIGWGLWEQATGMTAHLSGVDRRRVMASGASLTTAQGLDLLDAALQRDLPVVAAVNIDLAGLRAHARTEAMSPLWRSLIRLPASQPADVPAAGSLREQLAGVTAAEQDRLVLDLVRRQAAAVLGHPSADSVQPGAAFRDLGFDSLTAIELRNRLAAATGSRLSATLVFDHPSPRLLAAWLREAIGLGQAAPASGPSVLAELDRLEETLSAVAADDLTRMKVAMRLQLLLSRWNDSRELAADKAGPPPLDSASDDEMFDLINRELGR